jgi:AraC family transcriptional regulator
MKLKWLLNAKCYVEQHYRERLSLAEIASAVEVHPAHLARTFRARFGITVGSYIRRLRIEAAIEELQSHKPVVEIALAAGFYDQSHFHHVFKKYTGFTPAEFRLLHDPQEKVAHHFPVGRAQQVATRRVGVPLF